MNRLLEIRSKLKLGLFEDNLAECLSAVRRFRLSDDASRVYLPVACVVEVALRDLLEIWESNRPLTDVAYRKLQAAIQEPLLDVLDADLPESSDAVDDRLVNRAAVLMAALRVASSGE